MKRELRSGTTLQVIYGSFCNAYKKKPPEERSHLTFPIKRMAGLCILTVDCHGHKLQLHFHTERTKIWDHPAGDIWVILHCLQEKATRTEVVFDLPY
jgi:hypothetical protein